MSNNRHDDDAVEGTNVHSNESDIMSPMVVQQEIPISAVTNVIPISNTSSSSLSIIWNFVFMAILFSSNHGCVVACLSLATARLGSLGAYQSGLLYVSLNCNNEVFDVSLFF